MQKKVTLPFESADFEKHWNLWKQYKKEQHRFSYKGEVSEHGALDHLVEISFNTEAEAIKIIIHSIAQGWKGLFKIEKNGSQSNQNRSKPVRKSSEQAARDYLKQGGAEGFNGSQGNQNSGGGSN